MLGLPKLTFSGGEIKRSAVKFGGYDHNAGAAEGSLWDMKNLSSDCAPLLSPRGHRYLLRTLGKPNGFYARGGLFWVDGTKFYADGEEKGTVTDSEKTFCSMGDALVIFPDKLCYHRSTGELEPMEASWKGIASFGDGTYAGVAAAGNTITTTGTPFPFRVEDGIRISGCGEEENNQTLIIREISEDKKTLRFYENSFSERAWAGTVTLKREVPDLEFLCENENRLWGCVKNTIYACRLGDLFNWSCYDGLGTDSYAADVGSPGPFTACSSYLGYPVFFKEDNIYKVYGSKPANFQVMGSASLGVEAGSAKSLAIADERLFYLSRAGVVSYGGGTPTPVSQALGHTRWEKGVGGSDGRKYYLSVESAEETALFVFDTTKSLWHKEDEARAISFGWEGELYFLEDSGKLWLAGNPRKLPQNAAPDEFTSMAEFGDFTESDPDKKEAMKLQLRMELQAGARVTAYLQFDSDGEWHKAAALTSENKRSFVLPLLPRRCDHYRIRLEGTGGWKLYSLTREFYGGSEL